MSLTDNPDEPRIKTGANLQYQKGKNLAKLAHEFKSKISGNVSVSSVKES